MDITIIGAKGFVGSALVRYFSKKDYKTKLVTRESYSKLIGERSDVVIDASGNSKKYLAEDDPVKEFNFSVQHRLKTLFDFPADLHIHISSVDVYNDLSSHATTSEGKIIDPSLSSNYGFHKMIAEQIIQHYSNRWLIIRLAGMVGKGLRKNPVYDILNGLPIRIHPDSQYQFMNTDDVARIVCGLLEKNIHGEIFNVCGDGLVSPHQIASFADKAIDLSLIDVNESKRIVDISIDKIKKYFKMPKSVETIKSFISINHD
jgi:nucleoside-diphosphate-sugar epimerase